MFRSYTPMDLPTPQRHEYLLATIAPRPIAWVSTMNDKGQINLAPFSFFNVFSSNPPTVIFSPARRVKDNTTKHTLENVIESRECVINIVNYEMAGQMMLSSGEFPDGINEFDMARLTMEPSFKVKAPRVKESPAQFECIVKDVISLGDTGGAGSLVICEVVQMHLSDHVFTEDDKIDPHKVDNIARLGRIWYTRASAGLFQMPNPKERTGIGFDRLPAHVLHSKYLTGSDLARLASIAYIPTPEEITAEKSSSPLQEIIASNPTMEAKENKVHTLVKALVQENRLEEAWRLLYAYID